MLLAQDPQLARKVGVVSLAVLALGIAFFVFVYDRIEWGHHVRVHVYFEATGGLGEGAPFVVGGRSIGRVESIALAPRDANNPLAGAEGTVVTLAIDAADARGLHRGDLFVASRGALSGKYVELGPAEEGAPLLADGDQLRGRDPPSLDRVLQRTWDNLTTLGKFRDDVQPELDALRARLDELRAHVTELAPDVALRDDVSALLDEADRTSVALGGRAGLDRISHVMDDGRATVAQARLAFARLGAQADALSASVAALRGRLDAKGNAILDRVADALDHTRAALAKLDPLLAQIDALNAALARGEGSLMKLARDPEFPEDAKELGKILKRHPWRVLDHPHEN
ncbi:MAG TPA: MlaD family protein [Kofleriaceae bacterium]